MTQGYLIQAVNTDEVDYVCCARVLAHSIRATEDTRPITLLTNHSNYERLDVFDSVILLDSDVVNSQTCGSYSDDWQVYHKSPYDETFKLEADILVTRSLDSWWTLCHDRNIHIATGCRDYKQNISKSRDYRHTNDKNLLPDCYNGITYFKKCQLSETFYSIVRTIFANWTEINNELKHSSILEYGDTDTVYAIAATCIGIEQCTLPNNIIQFVHMKQRINNTLNVDWTQELIWEYFKSDFRIHTRSQLYPVHYYIKSLAKKLEQYYV
jgi:hypothetical protein